ncbi:hypothetical protein NLU13_0491 [Sarocladium strictum]|uniref:DUF221-domain-containing protein n=1 Tax=Sarocladium strictum TaxID=5046 RepID=A0AA39GPX6_SARSR|nr:hypothetical protein NLU13_0491 [Sarocladium strictum]
MSTTTSLPPAQSTKPTQGGSAQENAGIGLTSFLTSLTVAVAIFGVQTLLFLLLRNKLARIFKPKTYLVPERERTDPPPNSPIGLLKHLFNFSDREIIKKCGLDAYFFLRYLKTLLVIFVPIVCIVLPILIPINYVGGKGQRINVNEDPNSRNSSAVTGLDTLAWGNVKASHTSRYGAHLLMAILVIIWVCAVFFVELRVYIKVRQDHLTSAEHRLRASATTVLVSSIPGKWLSEEALRGLFDVFPGGIRNLWLNRDLTELLDKIDRRDKIHKQLESAETDLIKDAKKAQMKKRDAEEKKQRKKLNLKSLTKQERAERDAEEDAEAQRRANSAAGLNAGDQHEVPHDIEEGMDEFKDQEDQKSDQEQSGRGFKIPRLANPFDYVTQGVKEAVDAMEKTGQGVNKELETTNGFMGMGSMGTSRAKASGESYRHYTEGGGVGKSSISETLQQKATRSRSDSNATDDSAQAITKDPESAPVPQLNTVRKLEKMDDMYKKDTVKFWQFWKEPPGGYASPVPQGIEAQDYMTRKANEKKTFGQIVKSWIPFMGDTDIEPLEYPPAYNPDYTEEMDAEAEWAKYLKKKKRPTHHLPLFGVMALPGIPFITKKVDTIYYCREELARLNLEIEEDQKHPERYPLMNSAFIQFDHQVAAHMACQSVMHHIPRHMAPRINEVSPNDVIWDNMAFKWWQEWLRTGVVFLIVGAMIVLWAIPVSATAALSQLNEIIKDAPWLGFLRDNSTVETVAKALAGVLPALILAVLLILVPIILDLLAGFKGAKTGAQKSEFVQLFYFAFLFVQVFLIVSIASFFAASVDDLIDSLAKLSNVQSVLDLLAENLPKAANYFFSYMILQAMSTSSGTLLQVGALFFWYIVARIMDSTARHKWARNTNLQDVNWGKFFPVYTNFACIGLIYSIVAPLIAIFAIITFSLLWIAHRYAMVYVIRFESDTGGVMYPRAINQTFTGLYFMELCLAGLFFIVVDESGAHTCTPHGIVMIVCCFLTAIYQVLLNYAFSPLFRYLPITFEDEAVLRDEAFQRAQNRRLGLEDDEEGDWPADQGTTVASPRSEKSRHGELPNGDIEMDAMKGRQGTNKFKRNPMRQVGTWAKGGGNQLKKLRPGGASQAADYRRQRRQKDLEAQRAIGEALYGGFHDEIEDLTPQERDRMVRHAFTHSALRARRPVVWIPRDDVGISDDEIRRTKEFSEHIWITNEGTALDSKVRVVYGKNPPDFSEVDLINL